MLPPTPDTTSAGPGAAGPRELDPGGLRRSLRAQLLRWARAARPREACGVLLGTETDLPLEASLGPNRSDDPRRFELDLGHVVAEERKAGERGLVLLGFWHSHPEGPARPSARDLAAAWPGSLLLVVAPGAAPGARWSLTRVPHGDPSRTEAPGDEPADPPARRVP